MCAGFRLYADYGALVFGGSLVPSRSRLRHSWLMLVSGGGAGLEFGSERWCVRTLQPAHNHNPRHLIGWRRLHA